VGLVSGLLTLPLAPVRMVAWAAEQLYEQAYEQEFSEAAIRRQLAAAQEDLESGILTEQEYDDVEEALIERLLAARSHPAP
jgi:Gas vesicle protein G